MTLRSKILGSALTAAVMLAAGSASATTYILGDLSATGELSKSVKLPATSSPIADYFEFTVDSGTLLTYAQLEDTLNKSSSLLSNGLIQIETLGTSGWTVVPHSTSTYGSETASFILPTPEVDVGAGTYRIDVTGTENGGLKTNYTVGIFGEAVPEPATWAVMLMGFGAIGSSMRSARRRQASLTA